MKRLLLSAVIGFFLCPIFAQTEFITTWKTDNPGPSADNQITIPTHPQSTYDYTVDWGDGNVDTNVTGDITHTYAVPGTYTVSISGEFPRIHFNNGLALNAIDPEPKDKDKILTVEQWGSIRWTNFGGAFFGCTNLDVTATDVPDLSSVNSLLAMFRSCPNLQGTNAFSNWDISNIINTAVMFESCSLFNQDISNWDVSNAINISFMFRDAQSFNQDIGGWDVSQVISMGSVFRGASSFNQNISSWDVSNVTSMGGMFAAASSFNQDISSWDVSQVTDMAGVFDAATSFNQPLNNWDVSNATDMFAMFANASAFNQPLDNWDVSSVTDMANLFRDATSFDQDLGSWDISNVDRMLDMFEAAGLSQSNYDKTLIGWGGLASLQSDVEFDAGSSIYCQGEAARIKIVDEYNWTIIDSGKDCPFITTWKTDNPGTSDDNQITVPLVGGPYNIDWGDGNIETNLSDESSHTYANPGIYTVSVTGTPNFMSFNGTQGDVPINDALKILEVNQWGSIEWTTMVAAYAGCRNLDVVAMDVPDLSQVTTMFGMFDVCESLQGNESFNYWDVSMVDNLIQTFSGCTLFNADISKWDTSNVTSMINTFASCENFNQDISNWNVSNVTNMLSTFSRARSFNQDIGNWDVSNVTNMSAMFSDTGFNQDISNWNVSSVTDMSFIFNLTTEFNQDISLWDVSNVQDMEFMFSSTEVFNQDISNWDVSGVQSMRGMFNLAKVFDQDISGWNVTSVTNMRRMFFRNNAFDQDIGDWDISQVVDMTEMFANTAISTVNYDNTLNGWASLPSLQNDVVFDGGSSEYCESADARQNLIDTYNWTIIDAGESALCNVDNDADGVSDHKDSCLDTRPGVEVNTIGCEIIAVTSIRVLANTNTCPGESNGSIVIETDLSDLAFSILITGDTTNDGIFETVIFPSYEFNNLPAGDYVINLSIPSALFEQQYGIRIRELDNISGKRQDIDRTKKSATYTVSGSREYSVEVNGLARTYNFESSDSQLITIDDLEQKNKVIIKGVSDCQGLVEDDFDLDLDLLLYPVLTSGEVIIDGPLEETSLRIYDIYGRLIKSQELRSDSEPVFDLDGLPNGVYLVQITNDGMTKTHKIIKQ